MRKKTALFLFVGILTAAITVHAESTTMNSYYTSPYGSYQQIRLVPRAAIGGTCQTGTIYVNAPHNLWFCGNDSDADGTGTWGPMAGVWVQNVNDVYPSETSSNQNLAVGIGTQTPSAKLSVNSQAAGQDVMRLTDQGTEVFSVKDGGNVGINDPAPAARLSVSNAGTEDILNLNDGGTEVFTVLDGGKVGVKQPNPLFSLHLGDDSEIMLEHPTNTGIRFYDPDGSPDFQIRFLEGQVKKPDGTVMETHNELQMRFVDYPGETNPVPALTIEKRSWHDSRDEIAVGIGTENPTNTLHVVGSPSILLQHGSSRLKYYSRRHYAGWGNGTTPCGGSNNGDMSIYSFDGSLFFGSGNYERNCWVYQSALDGAKGGMTIGSYVLISSGVPRWSTDNVADYPLEVFGRINVDTGSVPNGFYKDGVCITGCSSSREVKKNIQPIHDSLERLTRLEPVSFEYKNPIESGVVNYGLIAEDVEKVFPEWVNGGSEPRTWGINYGPEVQMQIIQAVKELKSSFDARAQKIRDENDALRERIRRLEAR